MYSQVHNSISDHSHLLRVFLVYIFHNDQHVSVFVLLRVFVWQEAEAEDEVADESVHDAPSHVSDVASPASVSASVTPTQDRATADNVVVGIWPTNVDAATKIGDIQSTPARAAGPPAAKKKKTKNAESAATSPLNTANALMTAVQQSLMEPKTYEPPNSTRIFCDLLYRQLMTIPNEETREMLQYEIHSTVMRYKFGAGNGHKSPRT